MGIDDIMSVIEEEDFNVTLTGGDPLYHPRFVRALSRLIVDKGHNVWLYTGYLYEDILANPLLKDAIEFIDTIVDGPFIMDLKDPDLPFRGSSNQRIIKHRNL